MRKTFILFPNFGQLDKLNEYVYNNEIIRFLNSINPNNKISVFVLISQLRDY